tara:strand:- start:317 stop:916 length:600 start_codon:yes stop_codon:yes gene_type:complete
MFINTSFVLASQSKSRKRILKALGLKFKSKKPKINEQKEKEKLFKRKLTPAKISLELAKRKAKSVVKEFNNTYVLGLDTTISFRGKLVEKAKNISEAKEKIFLMSGKSHTISSSVAIFFNSKLVWTKTLKTKVVFRKLTKKEIKLYLNKTKKEILQSVGSYQLEKEGPLIIKNINGDFFNVMGFPVFEFVSFLYKAERK